MRRCTSTMRGLTIRAAEPLDTPPSADSPVVSGRAATGAGQRHDERRAAALGVGGRHAAAVRGDDRRHDGEPEAGAALAALAPALGAPEALEQRVGVVGRQAGAVVAHLEAHVRAVGGDADLDRRLGRGVDERVAQQVGEHLAQLVGVAHHDGRPVVLELDRAVGRGRAARRRRRRRRARRGRPRCAARRPPRRAARASAGPRRARPCAPPRPRSGSSPSRPPAARAPRPSGTAPRSRGSRPAACAARATRRR